MAKASFSIVRASLSTRETQFRNTKAQSRNQEALSRNGASPFRSKASPFRSRERRLQFESTPSRASCVIHETKCRSRNSSVETIDSTCASLDEKERRAIHRASFPAETSDEASPGHAH